jgi:uncharacterized protein YbjT (DUF2867 family)
VTDKKIIAVMGATGAQGVGLVRAILNDKSSRTVAANKNFHSNWLRMSPFAVCALTRNVKSNKARALASQGAEVVDADLDDLKSLKRAFAGAHGAYCVTFFWAHFSSEKEIADARALAQAARHADVQHAIWSTFEDTRK